MQTADVAGILMAKAQSDRFSDVKRAECLDRLSECQSNLRAIFNEHIERAIEECTVAETAIR